MAGINGRPNGASVGMRSIEEAISEVQRELQVRRRCYQRWCDDGKLSVVDARDRLDRLEAAERYLQQVVDSTVADPVVNVESAHVITASVIGA